APCSKCLGILKRDIYHGQVLLPARRLTVDEMRGRCMACLFNKLCVLCIGNFRAIHRESSDRHSVRWRFLRWAIRAPHLERAAGDGYQVRFDCFTTFGLIRIGGLLAWRRRIISRSAGPRHEVDATTSTDQHYEADDSGYERDG